MNHMGMGGMAGVGVMALCVSACSSSDKDSSDALMDLAADTTADVAVDHPSPSLKWYSTCGDPVCGVSHRPMPEVPACTTQMAGQPCGNSMEVCDPQSLCNELLRCSASDPKVQTGGCPISSRKFKYDINYLKAVDRQKMTEEVNRFRLAQYKYRDDPAGRLRLGFIIEDAPKSAAVDRERDQIDLYGYTSMVVAALQTEHEALADQRRQTAELRAEVERLKAAMKLQSHR